LPIIAGNTAGSFTLVIDRTTDVASLVPTGTTATNQVTVTSNSVITPTQPSTTQPVCGTASQTAEFTTNGQKHEFILAPGQTASVGFTARDGTLVKFSTTETQFTYAENDHQVTISTCAGTFTTTDPGCTYNAIMTGGQLQAAVGGANGVCGLVAGRKYYMNIRQVRLDGSNSCTNPSGCGIRAQNQGL
ncbi:MAG TPA: hypothetical protein VFK48_09400, partial [Usitatibacter sp.]|nr:hypothetical protein [Usitatibacter sp.]